MFDSAEYDELVQTVERLQNSIILDLWTIAEKDAEAARLLSEMRPYIVDEPYHAEAEPSPEPIDDDEPFDPSDHQLLKIRQVIRLPELGGHVSEKAIRSAVETGALVPIRGGPKGKLFLFKRQMINEWISSCQQTRISSSEMPATTKPVASRTARPGLSMMDRAELARDAARMTRQAQSRR